MGLYSLSAGGLAEGAIQNVSVSGTILTADAGNLFGLNVGDPISLQATFDDTTAIAPGIIPFDASTTNLLSITLGAIQLNEVNDIDFYAAPPAFPRLILCEDPLLPVVQIDFVGESGTNDSPVDYMPMSRTTFIAIDANGATITGEWTLSNCPEPSTLILAGLAAVGIVVRRMRRGR
jgi:hypothetical protein